MDIFYVGKMYLILKFIENCSIVYSLLQNAKNILK